MMEHDYWGKDFLKELEGLARKLVRGCPDYKAKRQSLCLANRQGRAYPEKEIVCIGKEYNNAIKGKENNPED